MHRSRYWSVCVLLALAASTTACGPEPDVPVTDEPDAASFPYTYAQHIEPILEARCVQCHREEGIGSFPLVGYENAKLWANAASHAVENRTMPPFPPDADDCAPLDDPRNMPREEREMFLRWVADGQPLGDTNAPAEFQITTQGDSLGTPTHRYPIAADYIPPVEVTEEYRCFRVDPKLTATTRFRGINADTATRERFHHAQVHVLPADRVAEVEALEGVDGRPGWPCYFNAGVEGLDPIGRFTPGNPYTLFPADTTVALEPGTQFVIDAYVHHYDFDPLDLSVVAWDAAGDESGAPVILELSDRDFVISAGEASVSTTIEAEVVPPTTDLSQRDEQLGQAVHESSVWSVDVHMHHWGRSARVEVVRSDESRDCLLHIPRWDEDWQGAYQLAEPVALVAGDRLVATCEWSNEPMDQPRVRSVQITPDELRWGLGELEEMCTVWVVTTRQ